MDRGNESDSESEQIVAVQLFVCSSSETLDKHNNNVLQKGGGNTHTHTPLRVSQRDRGTDCIHRMVPSWDDWYIVQYVQFAGWVEFCIGIGRYVSHKKRIVLMRIRRSSV